MKKTGVDFLLKTLQEEFPNQMNDIYSSNQLLIENICNKAKQMEYDNTRRIAYNAYNYGQLDDPTEGKFNKFFSESFKSE